jgi:hypothetical protein
LRVTTATRISATTRIAAGIAATLGVTAPFGIAAASCVTAVADIATLEGDIATAAGTPRSIELAPGADIATTLELALPR